MPRGKEDTSNVYLDKWPVVIHCLLVGNPIPSTVPNATCEEWPSLAENASGSQQEMELSPDGSNEETLKKGLLTEE